MILGAIRDTAFIFALEKTLGRVRQDFHLMVLAGKKPDPDFWEKRESLALEELKRQFFGAKAQEATGSHSPAEAKANEQYSEHQQQLGEYATFATHEKLKNIPCVGENNL